MPLTDSLRDDILASVPSLRAFAISLSGNGDRADDLVQETLLRAWTYPEALDPKRGSARACGRSSSSGRSSSTRWRCCGARGRT